MNEQPLEIISAFFDGEDADPTDLTEALAAPGGRDFLVELVELRFCLNRDDAKPSESFDKKMERILEPRVPRWTTRIPIAVAATIFVGIALIGFWIGSMSHEVPKSSTDSLPIPNRVLKFQPGIDWHSD